MAEGNQKPAPDEFTRATDFVAAYANHVRFEMSIWDLRIVFGQILKYGSPAQIEESAEITMPWLQAKAMALFLAFNVAAHEEQDGPIRIPSILLGPALKHLGDRHITLEEMFIEVVDEKRKDSDQSPKAG